MPKVKFIEIDGTEHVVDATAGLSVMDAAANGNVPGVDADCGGMCSCATCQVIIEPDWIERLAPASDREQQMLEFAAASIKGARLSCQITVTEKLSDLTVHVPETQGH
jgi:2Fe-2S ferredoxin